MHTCSVSIVSLAPLVVMQLVMRGHSCKLWVRLGGQLYVMTLTDSAASVQPPWVAMANFGIFEIEEIEASSRGTKFRIMKLLIDTICLPGVFNLLQRREQ